MRASIGTWLVAALALAGCRGATIDVVQRSFDRPGPVAFACFDGNEFVPLGQCRGQGTEEGSAVSLTALVSQTGRGEVAAVDLRDGRVIDADVRVPGFTFHRVGEVPAGLVVPPQVDGRERAHFTYVASFGSGAVQAVPTDRFRPDALYQDVSGNRVQLPAGPTDLVLAPGGGSLFAPVPAVGSVFQVFIGEDGLLESDWVEHSLTPVDEEPPPVDLTSPLKLPGRVLPGAYERMCIEGERAQIAPPVRQTPRAAVADGPDPRPVDLFLSRADGGPRLFVADANRPVVHVLELDDGAVTLGEPLPVGVPTRQVVLSPVVPVEVGSDAPRDARYLYAIDARDRSVLVADARAGSETYGAVLPVSTGPVPADRLDLPAGARAIEVVTPGLPRQAEETIPWCTLRSERFDEVGPHRLRGAFLAVALTDGSVRFVDIHDLDATCRGGNPSGCSLRRPLEQDVEAYIQRHRPRIGVLIRRSIDLRGQPSFEVDNVPGRVQTDGAVDTEQAPGLAVLLEEEDGEDEEAVCPPGQRQVFPRPDRGKALICSAGDPWATREQQWRAVWQGAIPAAAGGRGRFAGERLFKAADTSLCERGVLGGRDVERLPEDDYLKTAPPGDAPYGGDAVVITSDIPRNGDGSPQDPDCTSLGLDEREPFDVAFRIASAGVDAERDGELRLGGRLGAATLAQARACFPELVEFQVHTWNAYAVEGAASGFLHRGTSVLRDGEEEGGARRCTPDPERGPTLRGRAFPGAPYVNPLVSFRIGDRMLPSDTDAELRFEITGVPSRLAVDLSGSSQETGVLPETLVYTSLDERLYAVDVGLRRLVQIELDPLNIGRRFR